MLEFIEFALGRTIGKLLLIGMFAFPVLAAIGYFGVIGKASSKRKTKE